MAFEVWVIGGADSSGGAGVAADARALGALGIHPGIVITAVTAQSPGTARATAVMSADIVAAQIAALPKPKAIKIGMIGDAAIARVVARTIRDTEAFVVCDPVLASSSGHPLVDEAGIAMLRERIFPRADLITPNADEARLLELSEPKVVLKGGHAEGDAVDRFGDLTLTSPRSAVDARGTGCTFASVIAGAVALGRSVEDAIVLAKMFINRGLREAVSLGENKHALFMPADLPRIGPKSPAFPSMGDEIGFYPIVDSIAWLRRLLPIGIKTAQLRIKTQPRPGELAEAIALAREAGCRLFINDYWREAIALGAYGVHLGQEDLDEADLDAIRASGLRLGISTHCLAEFARAVTINPSYLAIGPIFPTTCKSMRFGPQGIDAISFWRRLTDIPLVAIGGLKLDHVPACRRAGATGFAVISDVTGAARPEARAAEWAAMV